MQDAPQKPADSFSLFVDALRNLWAARHLHVILAVAVTVPLTVLGFLGILDPLYAAMLGVQEPPGLGRALLLFFLWLVAWNTPALILWSRRFLLGPREVLRIGLGELAGRALWFAAHLLLMGAIVLGVSLVALTLLGAIVSIASGGGAQTALSAVPLFILLFGSFFYLAARFCLAFAAIALGRRLNFMESWRMTRGRGLAIFGAFTLAMLLSMIMSGVVSGLLAMLLGAGVEAAAGSPPRIFFLIDLVASPFAYASAALLTAIGARVYGDLVGQPLDARGIRA